jgi:hypothetical protein
MAKQPKCPVCKAAVKAPTKHAPFCSARCRDVDLGSWLEEGYRISRPMMPWELERALREGGETGGEPN